MSYFSEIQNKNLNGNIVIRFPDIGIDFTKRPPDSGLVTDPVYDGLVRNLKVNPVTLDIEKSRTAVSSYSFELVDKDLAVTNLFQNNPGLLLGTRVEVYLGVSTGSFDFSDYFKLTDTKVTGLNFKKELFVFTSKDIVNEFQAETFNAQDKLQNFTLAGATVLQLLTDISAFPASGEVKVGDELITYVSKDDGLRQITLSTATTEDNDAGGTVFNVTTLTDNPVDLILQIIISQGGGGPFDVLPFGLGIDPADIDVTAIEAIRDSFFVGETFVFKAFDVSDTLKFLENELLQPNNLRFIQSSASLVSLAILDQVAFGAAVETIDPPAILPGSVRWKVDDKRVRNVIRLEYDFNPETNVYETVDTVEDSDSITTYGRRKPLVIKSKGIKTTSGGAAIAADRLARWLTRLSTANPIIDVQTQLENALVFAGEPVRLIYDLPSEVAGDRNFDKDLEVLKRTLNPETGRVGFTLGFTSFTGFRAGHISPVATVSSVTSQSILVMIPGRAACFDVGEFVRLFDPVTFTYLPDAINEIIDITGDTITFSTAWVTSPLTGLQIIHAAYNNQADSGKRYAYASDGDLDFADGGTSYKITF